MMKRVKEDRDFEGGGQKMNKYEIGRSGRGSKGREIR
jgi:hypothetical protein